MSLLLDDVEERRIVDFDFHIVVYELVGAKNEVTNNTSSADGDQMAHNLERSNWAQKPIRLKEIFSKRRQKLSWPEEEVSHVLILGNPGTGMHNQPFC